MRCTARSQQSGVVLLGIVLAAVNLRAPLAMIGPLASQISRDTQMSSSAIGVLTTIALLTFALASYPAERLGARLGAERALIGALCLLFCGQLLRAEGEAAALYAGTFVLSVGISFLNVLLPVLVKQYCPRSIGLMTGVYSTISSLFAGIATGVSVPVALWHNVSWRGSTALWAVFTAAAALYWAGFHRIRRLAPPIPRASAPCGSPSVQLLKNRLARAVILFMGLQSMVYFCLVAWIPTILQARGFSTGAAGFYATLMEICCVPSALLVPALADRFTDHRLLGGIFGGSYFAGMLLFIQASGPGLLLLGILLIGLTSGAVFSLALSFIGYRTADSRQTSALSGAAQTFGYLLAAFGPWLMGAAADLTGSWSVSLWFLAAATFLMAVYSVKSGFGKIS